MRKRATRIVRVLCVRTSKHTKLHDAVRSSSLEYVKDELERAGKTCRGGLSIDTDKEKTPPCSEEDASTSKDADAVVMFRLTSLLAAQDEHGYTALMNACALDDASKSLAICELILDYAARVGAKTFLKSLIDMPDNDGYTCMHWASACNNAPSIALLVEKYEVDIDLVGKEDGETPLHRACRFGAVQSANVILNAGADASVRNKKWQSAVDVAGMAGRKVIRETRNTMRSIVFKHRVSAKTLVLHHPDCLLHGSHKEWHQESPERIRSVLDILQNTTKIGTAGELTGKQAESKRMAMAKWAAAELRFSEEIPLLEPKMALRVHTHSYLRLVERLSREAEQTGTALPFTPHVQKELRGTAQNRLKKAQFCDTSLSPGSRLASLRAAGAVIKAVESVYRGKASSAFALVRPPGHHAGPSGLEGAPSCGFCILNNVAVGAAHALRELECSRVAIVDFDVHHGNGTEAVVRKLSYQYPNRVFFASIHIHDCEPGYSFYPGTGKDDDMMHNVMNIPITPLWRQTPAAIPKTGDPRLDGRNGPPSPVRSGRRHYRNMIRSRLVPALRAFGPSLILISAGFDGGRDDIGNQKLGCGEVRQGLDLTPQDFHWMTEKIMEVARVCCDGRVVSVLEGGYGCCTNNPKRKRDTAAAAAAPKSSAARAFVTPTTSPVPKRVRILSGRNGSSADTCAAPPLASSSSPSSDDSQSAFEQALNQMKETAVPTLDRGRFASNVIAHIKALSGALF
eukprot:g2942.t1